MMDSHRNYTQQILVLSLILIADQSYAQAPAETESIVSTMAFSIGSMVLIILGWIIMRRLGGSKRDGLAAAAGMDLMELRKKNLLTPEELAQVSSAIARRMAEKDLAVRKLAAALPSESLLNDPEVRRLEALAMAAKAAEDKSRLDQLPTAGSDAPVKPLSAVSDLSAEEPSDSEESLDDIVLPPDVQQLADAGILTSEEIQNVKRRLKARK